jgi:hypothetical protein
MYLIVFILAFYYFMYLIVLTIIDRYLLEVTSQTYTQLYSKL